MPYANNEGIQLYYEVEGEGPPLVLGHGRGGGLVQMRERGYVAGLRDDYQVILSDARGHSRSDKPHDPDAYRLRLRAMDVIAVLDDLNIDKAHYFGVSYGGYTGWGIAKYVPERFHSLILSGGGPVVHDPDVHGGMIPLWEQGPEAVVARYKPWYGEYWAPWLEQMLLANDPEAMITCLSVREEIDFEDVRRDLTVPLMLINGERDMPAGTREYVNSMRNGTLVVLPGLGHEAGLHIDLMLPHIRKFLAEVGEG